MLSQWFRPVHDYLQHGVSEQVDQACDDFESQWHSGNRPQIESYLNRTDGPERSILFTELMAVELELRKKSGEDPLLEDYRHRFPNQLHLLGHAFEVNSARLQDQGEQPFLSGVSPFSLLPVYVARLIESHMSERAFPRGAHLIRQNEPGTSLIVLYEGSVEINTRDAGVIESVSAKNQGVQVLGEMSLLTEEPCSANVVALSPVRSLILPAETFHELAREYPEISVVLTMLVATRLGQPEHGDVLTGKTMDGYRILKRLGRGGMSVVYQAEELDSNRLVALKMLSHRLVYDDVALEQFQRESEIIQAITHRNIVQTYGRFRAFHTYFIVMEYCDGWTLRDVLEERGALSNGEVKQIVGQIASALARAHAADVIHRDIKPANIMLNTDSTVKLMDFGLAKPVIDTHPVLLNLTAGTPRYMAPEQFLCQQVVKQSDFFSLGCVTFEMLTGQPLMPRTDITSMIHHHENWQMPQFDDLDAKIEDDLKALLQTSLQRDPADRQLDLDRLARWADS